MGPGPRRADPAWRGGPAATQRPLVRSSGVSGLSGRGREGGFRGCERRSQEGGGVCEKRAAFGGFPAREVSPGPAATNRKRSCNKERRGAGSPDLRGAGGRSRWRADRPARPTPFFRRRSSLRVQRDPARPRGRTGSPGREGGRGRPGKADGTSQAHPLLGKGQS